MPSDWRIFWWHPALYLSSLAVRVWYGNVESIETEFLIFSIGWVAAFFISIGIDRALSRVSTAEIERERDMIRRFIRGKSADRTNSKNARKQ